MALRQYRIPVFYGIHQGVTENRVNEGESPDACNMETRSGRLSVAKGYVRENNAAFPDPAAVKRIFVWNRASGKRMLAATANKLYALDETAGEWKQIYTFSASASAAQYDFQTVKIASTEYLLIASGVSQMAKWDGISATATAFGSAEQLSNIAVNYVELHYARLFSAGDSNFPSRLYYSQAPGDDRSLENWTSVEASENVGGGHMEIGTDSDPITGLFALSNQLLIFKRDSLYRLLGDRPGNFRILPVNGRCSSQCTLPASALVTCYFSSRRGVCTTLTGRPCSARGTRTRQATFSWARTSPPAQRLPAASGSTLPFVNQAGTG